jgi:hypothetical protein
MSAGVDMKYCRTIVVGGRRFQASETMCEIFLAHVSDTISRGATETVPLLHEGGVDMLLISPTTTVRVEPATPLAA